MRLILIFTLLVAFSNALESSNCKKIECGGASNVCMAYANNVVQLGSCNNGYECPDSATDLLTQISNSYSTYNCILGSNSSNCNGLRSLGAGRECCNASDCASETCTNNKCVGKDSGASCTVSEECKADYYCNGSVCTEVKNEGDSCTEDVECPAGRGCNLGVCTDLVSLSFGESASDSKFCKSGMAAGNKCDEVIVKINNSEISDPYECNIGQTCEYYIKSSNYKFDENACPCNGVENATTSHCITSIQSKFDNGYLYERLSFDSSDCSGQVAHEVVGDGSTECDQIDRDDYLDWAKTVMIRNYWPLYKSGAIDDCAEDLELFDPDFEDDNGVQALMVGAMLALVFQVI